MHDPAQHKMQGKWILEQRADGTTELKYAVEMAMRDTLLGAIGLVDTLLERTIEQDVPTALAAIKRVAEGMAMPVRDAAGFKLMRDIDTFDALRAELTMLYGDTMMMPDRRQLLACGRCVPALWYSAPCNGAVVITNSLLFTCT